MLCHSRRVLSRGHPRGFTFSPLASIDCGAGKPSAESFDTASTSSTHAMNMSPGATLVLYFLPRRPSPRCDDYSRMGERVQATRQSDSDECYLESWGRRR